MPVAGQLFIVEVMPPHLGWGTYRHTDTREPIYGEGYIKIPRRYAKSFGIFNDNHPTASSLYDCYAVNGTFAGRLLAQGCSTAGDPFAKQFAEAGNLKGLGSWYKSVGAQAGGHVEVIFTSPTSLTIRYF